MHMSDSRSAAVAQYKKYAGKKKWEETLDAEASAQSVFDTLEEIYGTDNTVKMVKAVPAVLGYDPTNFKATFEAFSEVFGADETVGMVTRNPNLLCVRPSGFGGAINAKDDTMYMSYVIAYTRPIGGILLAGLFLCLSIPFVELSTGIPRQELLRMAFSTVSGGS
ncbi:unnamed protein product [Choristocarpus tenellus]